MKKILLAALALYSCLAFSNVRVGAYINDIQELELESHSYAMDLYIWFKWKDKSLNPAESFEFMNPSELWGHMVTNTYDKPEVLPDGTLYQVVRIQGRFSEKFNLADYPFDKQRLVVSFEDSANDISEGSKYVLDDGKVGMDSDVKLPGFEIKSPKIELVNQEYNTDFGDTRTIKDRTNYSKVVISVPIERPIFAYLIKLVLPIFCIVFCACLMFLFHPKYIDARVGVGITALLTVVALQITLNNDLPEVAYLILMDKIYIATYMFIILGLAVVMMGSWKLEKGEHLRDKIIKVDRISLGVLLGIYSLSVGGMLVQSI
ncbi:MAG: hypothetical protein CME64_06490 [Halobacteriovoraceae bacterium]|nr:hypothetical protein [Halobacteriovoraceae bacterium]|tara:strand:+ start:52460 stop:53413 length:954 start_codon:yes stop_codon:yes gene_type:complete